MSIPLVYLVIGTRPEAIKMAPLAGALRRSGLLQPVLVATGQHPTLVAQALDAFGEQSDIVIRLDRRVGDQPELVAALAPRLDAALGPRRGAAVVVQGDTTSALVGGLVAFWRQMPVVHLEAGLRSAISPRRSRRRPTGACWRPSPPSTSRPPTARGTRCAQKAPPPSASC